MTRELFVSSTPHETKVGLVEDDLLAEIYLERENEYTLAGSIYKDASPAFFPECNRHLSTSAWSATLSFTFPTSWSWRIPRTSTKFPPTAPAPERYQPQPQAEAHAGETFAGSESQSSQPPGTFGSRSGTIGEAPAAPASRATIVAAFAAGAAAADAAASACRNRSSPARQRKRRARLPALNVPNGPNAPNGMIGRSDAGTFRSRRTIRTPGAGPTGSERSEYGPPPGYQPIILPGESISKYQRLAPARPAPSRAKGLQSPVQDQPARPIAEIFADDEPLFAAAPLSRCCAERSQS